MKYIFIIILCIVGTFVHAQGLDTLPINAAKIYAHVSGGTSSIDRDGSVYSLRQASYLISLLTKQINTQQHTIELMQIEIDSINYDLHIKRLRIDALEDRLANFHPLDSDFFKFYPVPDSTWPIRPKAPVLQFGIILDGNGYNNYLPNALKDIYSINP